MRGRKEIVKDEHGKELEVFHPHPSEQWFVVRNFGFTIETKNGEPILRSTSKVEPLVHVHHPDSYHPDPRVSIAHARAERIQTTKLTACGLRFPRNDVFIEEHDEGKRCPDCLRATELAREVHAKCLLEKDVELKP